MNKPPPSEIVARLRVCPTCGAPPGERCESRYGTNRSTSHPARFDQQPQQPQPPRLEPAPAPCHCREPVEPEPTPIAAFTAASQLNLGRVDQLLADMSDSDLESLHSAVTLLAHPVAVELSDRRLGRDLDQPIERTTH